MVKFTKYLSICVILASSRFVGAGKLPTEDCDTETGSDYFASGSAHSSQYLMPDGSLVTNSKGSSLTSDGVQRTFHELKKEANKYVSKSSDGLTIPGGALIPDISGSHFSQFFKNGAGYTAGQQSNFLSSQSGSSGSSQHFDQQQFSQLPAESKITSFKKQEVKKVIKSSSGLNAGVTGEHDLEQNPGVNSNANVETFIYKPAGAATQSGYSSSHHQESGSFKVSGSNVNPLPDTDHQTVYYQSKPLELYEREENHGSADIRVSGAKGSNPSTVAGKTIIYSSIPNSDASSSTLVSKVESHSQRQDANADIPSYLITKPNTYSVNVVDLDKINVLKTVQKHLPVIIPATHPDTTESHYDSQSFSEHTQQKESKYYAVPAVLPGTKAPNLVYDNEEVESLRPEELDSYGNKRVLVSSEKVVAVPSTDGRHTRFQIKVQAPLDTTGGSQIYRKETRTQSVKTFGSDSGAVLSESEDRKNGGSVQPVPLSASQTQTGEHFEENVQKSGDAVQIPILLHGVPQNTGYYNSKSGSSSSQSFSSGSQFSESAAGSQKLKYTGGATGFDADSLFGNSDKFTIPIQTYVSPVQTYVSPGQTSSKSSSSSSYHYFSSNGQTGEQLVPNSSIFGNSDGSSLQQSHASLLQNLGKSNVGSDGEFVFGSSGTPQKKTYGFSTAYSSHSSNVNGKVTENREASVAVNDNGKIDSYHVKS